MPRKASGFQPSLLLALRTCVSVFQSGEKTSQKPLGCGGRREPRRERTGSWGGGAAAVDLLDRSASGSPPCKAGGNSWPKGPLTCHVEDPLVAGPCVVGHGRREGREGPPLVFRRPVLLRCIGERPKQCSSPHSHQALAQRPGVEARPSPLHAGHRQPGVVPRIKPEHLEAEGGEDLRTCGRF